MLFRSSIELTILILIANILVIESNVLTWLTFAAAVTVLGHLVAILSSSRLRA